MANKPLSMFLLATNRLQDTNSWFFGQSKADWKTLAR
jgi:hypothetical protein